MEFRILAVCTGNICRSPLMELLLRRGIDERLGPAAAAFSVASAGTRGLQAHPMDVDAALVAVSLGADPSGFASRRLVAGHLGDVDLVLTATREQRTAVVTLAPRMLRRAFTLTELARVVATLDPPVHLTDPVEHARAVVALAVAARGPARAADPADDDLEDPIGRGSEVHERVGARIADAVGGVLGALLPT